MLCFWRSVVTFTICFVVSDIYAQTCPPGVEQSICEHSPCSLESCPSFPNATCSDSLCGGCQAVFTQENGNLIPKFACPVQADWPQCLAEIRCPYVQKCITQCPAIPNAECNPNCHCEAVFSDSMTGRVFSKHECNPECPQDNPPVECDVDPCDEESCPGRPEATCVNYNCGGCHAVFVDPLGEIIPKFSCAPNANYPACLSVIQCPSITDLCERGCPGVPDARCHQSCRCGAVFTYPDTGEVIAQEQCNPQECPPERPIAQCAAAPCDEASCPGRPDSSCVNNYCGGCHAVFIDNDYNVVPKFSCEEGNRWPTCLISIRCAKPAVSCTTGCPGVANAICSLTCGCEHVFTDRVTGEVLTSHQCNPPLERLCEPLIHHDNDEYPNLLLSCTNGRRVGSHCTVTCTLGFWLHGVKRTRCKRNREWSKTLGNAQCVPVATCSAGMQQLRCSIDACNSARCPAYPEAVCVANRCGSCNDFDFYQRGSTLTRKQCLLQKDCLFSFFNYHSFCLNRCKNSVCSGHPNAVCRVNCFCRPSYYEFKTLQPMSCLEPDRSCEPLIDPQVEEETNLVISCTNGRRVGSTCTVSCPHEYSLRGTSQVMCRQNGEWSKNLENTQCIPRIICPLGTSQVRCARFPCDEARCPAYPNAACVGHPCGGCNFEFFQNGVKLSRKQCLLYQDCTFSFINQHSFCLNQCRHSTCPGHPDAICRVNCFCRPKFYDSTTLELLTCDHSDAVHY